MKTHVRLGMLICILFASQFLGAQCASDLIISEYVEGSSNNKYLEIYNGTGAAVNLTNYSIDIYFNGATTTGSNIALSGSLPDGDTYIIANTAASVYAGTPDQLTGSLSFNGDDAVALLNTGSIIDLMGTIGGTATYGSNQTLQRQTSITSPVPTYNSSEWISLPQNDVSGLASHSINCGGPPCTSPNSNAVVTLTAFLESIQVDINPPSGGADNYFIVIKTSNSIVQPSNGTSYALGSSYDGGTVIGFGSTTSLIAQNLNPNTTYYVFVFAFNSVGCTAGPSYATAVSPSPSIATLIPNPSTLQPGDFNILGFDTYTASGGADRLVLTNLVELGTGTSFLIGNMIYEFKAAAAEQTGRWYNGNGVLTNNPPIIRVTYGGPALPAGSVICMEITSSGSIGTVTSSGIDISNRFRDDTGGFSFVQISANAPDAIFLMQGSFTNGLTDGDGDQYGILNPGGRVLGGLQTGGDFQSFVLAGNAGGSRVSRVHPDIECFAISTGPGAATQAYFGYYDVNNAITSGSQHQLLKSFADFTNNWVRGLTSGSFPADGDDIGGVMCASSVFVSQTSAAESGNWIGDTDGDWFNCLNWDKLEVPDATTDVVIGDDAQANCEVDVSAYATNAARFGNIAMCNNLEISSSSHGLQLSSASDDSLIVNGNLLLEEGPDPALNDGGGLDMDGSGGSTGGTLVLRGNLTDNNLPQSLFMPGNTSKILFDGSNSQTISVAATAASAAAGIGFAFVEVDNALGLDLAGRVEVGQELTFTNGVISSATGNADGSNLIAAANILVFADDATTAAASDASHVNGIVSKIGDEDFGFPVGNGTFLRPAGLSGGMLATTNDEFRVEFFFLDPDGPFAASNMNGVTNTEFWNIERMPGTLASKAITLNWDQGKTSDVNDPSVVRLNTLSNPGTDFWELAGGNGQALTTGPGLSGAVSSAVVSEFSPFTFSDATAFPIELIYFNGQRVGQTILLKWETSYEKDNSHFLIERSSNNRDFSPLSSLEASGKERASYQWIDRSPASGDNYYRLRQYDLDGSMSESPLVNVFMPADSRLEVLSSYPNPVRDLLSLKIQSPESGQAQLKLFMPGGQLVNEFGTTVEKGVSEIDLLLDQLAAGMYFYEIILDGQRLRGKFLKI